MDNNATKDKSFGQKFAKTTGVEVTKLIGKLIGKCFVCHTPDIELKDIIFVSLDSHHALILFLLSAPPLFTF